MADDRHYVPGSNYILDDLSGFKVRVERARIIPGGQTGGLAVDWKRWEDQQPQDFVTGVSDEIAADLVRSRQPNQFVILGTYVVAPSARGSNFITVESAAGFQQGMPVQIMLDTGVNQQTQIQGIEGNVFQLLVPLTATVGTLFGDPIENSVLSLGGPQPLPDADLTDDFGVFMTDDYGVPIQGSV
jgi:hypothetical protein